MQILTNTGSLFAQRALARTEGEVSSSLRRLSSGLRVNSAKDDPAGLAIAERLRSQQRGTAQASRNANDAISLLQTTEGAMASVGDMLQRVRELAVQAANTTNSASDREALQQESNQLIAEISRIGASTEFNGEKVFAQSTTGIGGSDPNKRAVLDGLKLGWLENSETLIRQYYGIEGDNQDLTIDLTFTDGAGNVAASVSGNVGPGGKTINMKLNIDMADFTPPNLPNGGTKPFYNDRIIAHEMVHAVMGRAMDMSALPTWFLEGSAELIHGADERVQSDTVASVLGNRAAIFATWGGSSLDYSTAYTALRYMHSRLKEMGADGGIKEVMTYLHDNQSTTLSAALNAVTNGTWANVAAFQTEYIGAAGATFINAMNLTNADTGAVGGFDADNGDVRTAESVIADNGTSYGDDTLTGFKEIYPKLPEDAAGNQYSFHVGANAKQTIDVRTASLNAGALGIQDIDLVENASLAIVHVDQAINYLNRRRADIGASQSRMESTIAHLGITHESSAASLSRIVDADFAEETARMTRSMILQQAATSMIAQANAQPQLALQLLG